MIQVDDYLQLGLRGIVRINVDNDSDNMRFEHTLVGFNKDGKPVRCVVCWFLKRTKYGLEKCHDILSYCFIDQSEYESLIQRYRVLDDLLYYQRRARRDKAKRDADNELAEMAPTCSICCMPMTLKFRPSDGQPIWECIGFAHGKCSGSMPVSNGEYKKYRELISIAR